MWSSKAVRCDFHSRISLAANSPETLLPFSKIYYNFSIRRYMNKIPRSLRWRTGARVPQQKCDWISRRRTKDSLVDVCWFCGDDSIIHTHRSNCGTLSSLPNVAGKNVNKLYFCVYHSYAEKKKKKKKMNFNCVLVLLDSVHAAGWFSSVSAVVANELLMLNKKAKTAFGNKQKTGDRLFHQPSKLVEAAARWNGANASRWTTNKQNDTERNCTCDAASSVDFVRTIATFILLLWWMNGWKMMYHFSH